MTAESSKHSKPCSLIHAYISQQQTTPYPAITLPDISPPPPFDQSPDDGTDLDDGIDLENKRKQKLTRLLAIVVILVLAFSLYIIWRPSTADTASPVSQQNFGSKTVQPTVNTNAQVSASTTSDAGSTIQVYIVGAVQHPGVYTLAGDARVYQLLQAAGGPLPQANLAALNLAARLSDGQEVYVTAIGETPPTTTNAVASTPGTTSSGTTSQGALININSASADELKQALSISNKTAQTIVNYRLQHGPFPSVNALLQAVSKAIYNKIKDKVTV